MSVPAGGELRRVIGFWGGTALIIGITIGSGIFRKPGTLAANLPNPWVILGLWSGLGAICIFGALAVAELASMLPKTGGSYVFLRAAYGDSSAFVFGWIYLMITAPAGVGALAQFFAELLLGVLGYDLKLIPHWVIPTIASGAIVVLSVANLLGAAWGSAIQGLFTFIKVAALCAIMLVGLFLSHGSFGHFGGGRPVELGKLGGGIAGVIWAYDGWIAVSMIAGEVVAPDKLMKRIIVFGMAAIVFLYVGANIAYIYAMPLGQMADVKASVPQKLMSDALSPGVGTAITFCIMCSVLGALSGCVLAKPRVSYALAQDGLTFRFLGLAHPRWSSPYAAILIQAAVAIVLVFVLNDFDVLTTYFVVVEWFALLFTVGAVIVLRKKMPDAPRPYRTPGYPWVPLLFLLGTTVGLAAIVWGEIHQEKPNYSPLWGLLIAASGFPIFWIWKRLRPPQQFVAELSDRRPGGGPG
ncbi:MAG TPA: amino acid permease [Planctomycetota bacterium]|jgi:amino acid transporter|nr:amino acid permease [Planctomycetota bacterium]